MPKLKEIYEQIATLPRELKLRIESVYTPELTIPSELANNLLDFDECNDKKSKDIAKGNIIKLLSGNNTRTRSRSRSRYRSRSR